VRHPVLGLTIAELCERLGGAQLQRVTPLAGERLVEWGKRTLLMGVLNVTPDSFSDGGEHNATLDAAVAHALSLESSGADIIDIGGQSTRPGAALISAEEELSRVAPVVERLRAAGVSTPISADTFRADVAESLLRSGVDLVNDVSGGRLDERMFATVAAHGSAPVVAMHSRGTPETMQSLAAYCDDVVGEVRAELASTLELALEAGVPRWRLISDPGIGFAKTREHNLEVLRGLERLGSRGLGYPMMVGVSRKAFIGSLLGGVPPKERIWGTAGACAACIPHADILRVHDVAQMKEVVTIVDAIQRAGSAASGV
jgi:dihydropteroate synthase